MDLLSNPGPSTDPNGRHWKPLLFVKPDHYLACITYMVDQITPTFVDSS